VRWLLTCFVAFGLSLTAKAQGPPVITANPVATLHLVQGGSATITAAADGGANANGYWLGSSVPGVWSAVSSPDFCGATSTVTVGVDQQATLVVTNFQASDAGSYELVVTNAGGSATSSVVTISAVLVMPGSFASGVLNPGLGAVALWPLNETGDPSTGTVVAYDIIGGFNGIYGTNAVNGGGNAADGLVPVPGPGAFGLVGLPIQGALGCTTGVAQSTVTAAASPALPVKCTNMTIVAWIQPTVSLEPGGAGLVFMRSGGEVDGLCYSTLSGSPATDYLGNDWNNGNQGNQTFLSPPANTWSMVAMVVTATNTTLYVCDTNGIFPATQTISNAYQSWGYGITIGGDALDAATGALNFNGNISSVAMFTNALSFNQIVALYYAGQDLGVIPPPVISSQPVSTAVYESGTATFSVQASGTLPITYQWQVNTGPGWVNVTNGNGISGANTNTLVISDAPLSLNNASYRVVASDIWGSTTSTPVALSVGAVVVYQGLTNYSLGNATLAVSSNQLTVGNLGTNGQDGVSIALPGNQIGLVWLSY
jgi:hypothetical protein